MKSYFYFFEKNYKKGLTKIFVFNKMLITARKLAKKIQFVINKKLITKKERGKKWKES